MAHEIGQEGDVFVFLEEIDSEAVAEGQNFDASLLAGEFLKITG